jgi:hypothetical protein
MMSGFSTTMYAIVMNVTRPPRTSRLTFDPRFVISKKVSMRVRTVGRGVIVVVMAGSEGVRRQGTRSLYRRGRLRVGV